MRASYPSLAHAIETGPTATLVAGFRSMPDGRAQMCETRCPPGQVSYTSRPEFTLTCTLRSDKPGHIKGRRTTRFYRLGDFEMALPRCSDSWTSDGAAQFINLALPEAEVERVMGLAPAQLEVLHDTTFRCERLSGLLLHLWDSLAPGALATPLLNEGLYHAVLGQLALLSEPSRQPQVVAGKLCRRIMADIDERIAETGDQKISAEAFAARAGMSVATFRRRFKATTGQSVHQYVIDQRLKRARQMLGGTDLQVGVIAHACGFGSQSHMTDVFRTRHGVSPAVYRRDFR